MNKKNRLFDRWLLLSIFSLVGLGLLMVASSSIVISDKYFGTPFHYLFRQLIFLSLGIFVALFILQIKTDYLARYSGLLLLFGLFLLFAVLIPGIGHAVNGSTRWIGFGPLSLQVSELAKLCFFIYLAGFLVRHADEVRTRITGFIKPMVVLTIVAFLLLLEPDFGTVVVISLVSLGMMFLAGVRLTHFIGLFAFIACSFVVVAISSPYRLARLTSFMNPWANQFDSGYQLTQSLIAFGRGGWFGTGLGESVQKLFYLPEAHTDFLFAVLAEELGFIGILGVIALFTLLVSRAFVIARTAQKQNRLFASYLAYGVGLWIGLQAMVSMGVNSGLLPTKGLTLPLMSYGGSSLLVICAALGILLRIDYEGRVFVVGTSKSYVR